MKKIIQGLLERDGSPFIRELEVSITSKCHLNCDNCGFNIPFQPMPSLNNNPVDEISACLNQLKKLNVKIGSLGVLGGEPTINKTTLKKALSEFSKYDNIEQIELVTHGLTPQNIALDNFKYINKLTVSVYFKNEKLIELWEKYIELKFPHINLEFRRDKMWDKWLGEEIVDDIEAQRLFDTCWYRKHCVTIERQRLFICSRIPKFSKDEEGLLIDENTTLGSIKEYLNKPDFSPSCKTCIPMMNLGKIKAGVQPDDRISKMIPKAIKFLENEIY